MELEDTILWLLLQAATDAAFPSGPPPMGYAYPISRSWAVWHSSKIDHAFLDARNALADEVRRRHGVTPLKARLLYARRWLDQGVAQRYPLDWAFYC